MEAQSNIKLISFDALSETINHYYKNGGLTRGLSTGWRKVDEYLLLEKGLLMVVTGIPSSGKSEFMDQLMLQTIILHNWHWTVFSPENWPLEHHFQKLAEKWIGKPMFHGYNTTEMTQADVELTCRELSGSIHFINPPEGDSTIESLLKGLLASKEQFDTDAFLLDPWNELEHNRPNNMSETEYIGQTLSRLRNFGRRNKVLMNVVAHPTKLPKGEDGNYPVPTPYDISGSSNWRNKADVCIALWRDYVLNDDIVQLHIQKVRNKNLGKLGNVNLYWCRGDGLFFDDPADVKYELKHGIRKIISQVRNDSRDDFLLQ